MGEHPLIRGNPSTVRTDRKGTGHKRDPKKGRKGKKETADEPREHESGHLVDVVLRTAQVQNGAIAQTEFDQHFVTLVPATGCVRPRSVACRLLGGALFDVGPGPVGVLALLHTYYWRRPTDKGESLTRVLSFAAVWRLPINTL